MANELRDAYRPGTFLHFYHGEWDDRLSSITIPHMEGASWDRRAAYLLWLEQGGTENTPTEDQFPKAHTRRRAVAAPAVEDDDFGGLI
jgi:hypothetical protein